MALLYRVDSGRLGKVSRTPQGGWRVPATIARVGIVEYPGPNGKLVREYNPPEVLQAALATLSMAPVTDKHPRPNESRAGEPLVFADNYKRLNVGTVDPTSLAFVDGEIKGDLVLLDEGVAASIERGREEVSAGYKAAVDYTPGVTPEGQPYDGRRTQIIFNHVAVVDTARAGSRVRLALDSVGTAFETPESDSPVKVFVDGKEVPAEQVQSVLNELSAKNTELKTKLDAAEGQRDGFKSQATELKTKLDAAIAERDSVTRIDAAVTERVELLANATKVLGDDVDLKGKTAAEIKTAVVAKAYPEIKLDGKSADFVDGLYTSALQTAGSDPDGVKKLEGRKVVLKTKTDEKPTKSPRELMIESRKDAHKVPLAFSKQA